MIDDRAVRLSGKEHESLLDSLGDESPTWENVVIAAVESIVASRERAAAERAWKSAMQHATNWTGDPYCGEHYGDFKDCPNPYARQEEGNLDAKLPDTQSGVQIVQDRNG